MKATEQYFPVVLFIMLYKVILTFEIPDEIFKCSCSMQMKATERYFPVILIVMLYKVVLVFELVDEIFRCLSVPIQMKGSGQHFNVALLINCVVDDGSS